MSQTKKKTTANVEKKKKRETKSVKTTEMYLGRSSDGEHKRGHSGAAEVQQTALERKLTTTHTHTKKTR